MHQCTLALTIAAAASLLATPAGAEPLDGAYRGSYVCEKTQATRNILRVPIDLVVNGTDVRFGRPLFNLKGTRVTGTEMASGTIDGTGKVRLNCEYVVLGFAVHSAMTAPSPRTAGH